MAGLIPAFDVEVGSHAYLAKRAGCAVALNPNPAA